MHHFDWCAQRRPHLLAGDDPARRRCAPRACAATRGRSPTAARRSPGTRSRRPTGSGARKRSFCSSVPCAITVGPPIVSAERVDHPRRAARGRAPRRRSPSRPAWRRRRRTRPASVSPAQPRSLSLRCQARRKSKPRLVALRPRAGVVVLEPAAHLVAELAAPSGVSVRSTQSAAAGRGATTTSPTTSRRTSSRACLASCLSAPSLAEASDLALAPRRCRSRCCRSPSP